MKAIGEQIMNATRLCVVVCGQLVLQVSGCSKPRENPPYSINRIVLLDVQGLTGGWNLYIDREGSGWQETVKRGKTDLETVRFRFATPEPTLKRFAALLGRHDFFGIKTKDRPGIPDEARPTIYVETTDGRNAYVSKWVNDKHRDFDLLYKELLRWSEDNQEQIGSRCEAKPFDWNWRPEGFSDIKY